MIFEQLLTEMREALLTQSLQKLMILHTNDIHSRFDKMPLISAFFNKWKQTNPSHDFIIIDCGDHMDRMMPETEGTMGLANIEIMNQSGYDLATIGNNEGLTFTPAMLHNLYAIHAEFQLICANLYEKNGQRPEWIAPYRIKEFGELRVGFIAVTAAFTPFYQILGWMVTDPIQAVAEWVSTLRKEVEVLVVISHLGLHNDEKMAREIEGIDLILGAHTHHLLERGLMVNNTLLCAAGKFGNYLGTCEIQYNWATNKIANASALCLEMDGVERDPAIDHLITHHREISKDRLSKSIAWLKTDVRNDYNQDSPLSNLLALGLRRWTEADIGIVNTGQLLEGLQSGEINAAKLLAICPSPINPCQYILKGKHLWTALEESLLEEFIYKPIFGFGFRGKVLGTLCFDGMEVYYDHRGSPYHKIKEIIINGFKLEMEKEYKVGTIDMFTFGIGYLSLKEGSAVKYYMPEFIRDVLSNQLQDDQQVLKCFEPRWKEIVNFPKMSSLGGLPYE